MVLATDTLVRTQLGPKRVDEISIGDILFNEQDQEVVCDHVGESWDVELKTISYLSFSKNASQSASFSCSADHLLRMIANCPAPRVTEREYTSCVILYTRCNQNKTNEEWKTIHLNSVLEYIAPVPGSSTLEEIIKSIEELVSEYFSNDKGMNCISENLQDGEATCYANIIEYISLISDTELANKSKREILQNDLIKAAEEFSNYLKEENRENVDVIMDGTTSNGAMFKRPVFLSKNTKQSLDDKQYPLRICLCQGLRETEIICASSLEANKVSEILKNKNYSEIIDPFHVNKGDIFIMSVDDLEKASENCNDKIMEQLKITRYPRIPDCVTISRHDIRSAKISNGTTRGRARSIGISEGEYIQLADHLIVHC